MLYTFNSGDIANYKNLVNKYKPQLAEQVNKKNSKSWLPNFFVFFQTLQQTVLMNSSVVLEEKIHLLALMELFFVRPSENRTLSFVDVANALQISKDSVERLVMKAMSIKLLKGLKLLE